MVSSGQGKLDVPQSGWEKSMEKSRTWIVEAFLQDSKGWEVTPLKVIELGIN